MVVQSQQKGIWRQTILECPARCGTETRGSGYRIRKEPAVNGFLEAKAAKQESSQLGGCIKHLVLGPLFGGIIGSLAQSCFDGM